MSYKKELEQHIKNIVKECGYEIDKISLESSSRRDLGDFQLNIAMPLAKKYSKNPREIAQAIADKLSDKFDNINIAGPGFINLSIKKDDLIKNANESINNFDKLIDKLEKKTIVLDYGGANAAKELHVGHMRPANIGESLKRLAKVLGMDVISDVHLGDIGRQSGMVISELKRVRKDVICLQEGHENEYTKLQITPEELAIYYPRASKDAKENESRMEEVRQITAWVDEGKEPYFSLWKDIVEVSSNVIKEAYDKLNCTFDLWEGELSSLQYVKPMLEILKPYMYESQGALVIDVSKEDDKIEIPPLIVIKTDGSTIYATRDLATIYSRVEKYNPDEIWYVVDIRQSGYFEQVFRASYKTGLVRNDVKLAHYPNGTLNGSDGKPFKTRDGGVMSLNGLMTLVKEELNKKITNYESEEEKNSILDKLTVATIKYADLLPFRATDYIFDVEKLCSFEGKTGPYVLYTMVRIKSILKKVSYSNSIIKDIFSETERNIYLKLLELTKIMNNAYNEKTLSYICEYSFELCSLFNKFYGETNIVNEENKDKQETYIALITLIYNTLENLTNILAIDVPEKM